MGAWDVKLVRSASYAPKEVTLSYKNKILSLPSPLTLERGSPQTDSNGKGYEVTNTRTFDPVSFPFLFPPPVSERTHMLHTNVRIHCSQKSQYWPRTIPHGRD